MNRVVITGVGIINSIANNFTQVLPALRACTRNIKKVSLFATTADYPVAEVKDLQRQSQYRTLDLAEKACSEAIQDSGIDPQSFVFSTSTIGMPELEENFLLRRNQRATSSFSYNEALSVGEFANTLARKHNIRGTTTSFSTACSSSANAIGYAFLQVQHGICTSALAGGSDALCRLTYYGFQSLKVMSPLPCTPFDKNRQGMNLGEGAAFVVLETLENAQKRGAKIYAEVMGVGMSADGHHMSAPDPQGSGAALAMNRAIKNAHIAAEKISYISAHGTGTMLNDHTESMAIHKVFQEHTRNIYVNSLKSYVGHTLGAAGATAIVIAICSMKNRYIPPTLGLCELDDQCSLRMVPQGGMDVDVPYAMVNAFAFGGNNTCLVLGNSNA